MATSNPSYGASNPNMSQPQYQQQQQQQQLPPSSAQPTLRVMRLYKPDLYRSDAQPSLSCAITSFLTLPDSFGVIHVGETFTAYLGVLNSSPTTSISKLYVTVKLQTPSRRFDLVGGDEEDGAVPSSAKDVLPLQSVDMIVAKGLEEAGTHTLRVSVQYGQGQTLRKFYKFNVDQPLRVSSLAVRGADDEMFVATAVTNLTDVGITIFDTEFQPGPGLIAEKLGGDEGGASAGGGENFASAVDLFDKCGRVEAKSTVRYLFRVSCLPPSSPSFPPPCISFGAEIGCAVFSWRKAMGESGRIASPTISCPAASASNSTAEKEVSKLLPVAHRSGETVDAAAAARERAGEQPSRLLTVDAVSPPEKMKLNEESVVKLRITNHGEVHVDAQLQLRLKSMAGVVVCGPSFQGVGAIMPGGCADVQVRLLGLVAGLCQVAGCVVVDTISGEEISQPPLFNTLVER